eukprot:CAMPEP_0182443598 /NCGR_PEP_ID=MMETSP1172-20130603/2300_1 /TAXON_ID=708627 /ORGANISM="Timspurckia oligopyrenoides, Strain CCMP3278" /LENGTH=331 /DNA_ID=CAMNT_0024638939 /DNA_START=79 /DNA_END=1074 /DNA_ORIENTATION=-
MSDLPGSKDKRRFGWVSPINFIFLILGSAITALVLAPYLVSVKDSPSLPSPVSPTSSVISKSDDCAWSMKESDGFFCVSDKEWEFRRKITQIQSHKQCQQRSTCCSGEERWYEKYFEPEWTCLESRAGRQGDGGKWICDELRISDLSKEGHRCLIYSVGSNNDFSFEIDIYSRLPMCEIYTFDPTLGDRTPKNPDYVKFYPWGIAGKDDPSKPNYFKLQTIMKKLGHEGLEIMIFKIDVEGHEFPAFRDLFQAEFLPMRQILLEAHSVKRNAGLFINLRRRGFAIYHKEPNLRFSDKLHEYAFIRLNKDFFRSLNDSVIDVECSGWADGYK